MIAYLEGSKHGRNYFGLAHGCRLCAALGWTGYSTGPGVYTGDNFCQSEKADDELQLGVGYLMCSKGRQVRASVFWTA